MYPSGHVNIKILIIIIAGLEDVSLHELHHHLVLHGNVPDEVQLDAGLDISTVRTHPASVTADSFGERIDYWFKTCYFNTNH